MILGDEDNEPYFNKVASNEVPNRVIVNKYGANAAIGANYTPITDTGTYQTPTTLQALEILSDDNTNDKAGGTGALTVEIFGLGTSWLEVTEIVTLNGTTAVALANSYFRVYRIRIKTSGTYANAAAPSHDSTITLQGTGGGVLWGTILPSGGFGLASSDIGVYSIPDGYEAQIQSLHLDIEASKGNAIVDLLMFKRENADDITTPFSPMIAIMIKKDVDNRHDVNGDLPLASITGPADVGFMARVDTGTVKMEVEFQLLLKAI